MVSRAKHSDCDEYIRGGKYSFRDVDAGQLNSLRGIKPCSPKIGVVGRVWVIGRNNRGNVQAKAVKYD